MKKVKIFCEGFRVLAIAPDPNPSLLAKSHKLVSTKQMLVFHV